MLEQVRLGPVLEEQEGRGEDVPVQEMELEGQRLKVVGEVRLESWDEARAWESEETAVVVLRC